MEIRCKELSVVVKTQGTKTQELPSIANSVKSALRRVTSRTVSKRKHILNRVNAVFEPGTLTLVLGQPGSGKSTLLRVLSGQLPMDKSVTVEGNIAYNGLAWRNILPKLPQLAAYVPQTDQHFPSLTVQETLKFAHACCGESTSSPEQNEREFREICEIYPNLIIEQLGLKTCRDTKIGNDWSRGVSGGERRRVTTGEMEFGTKFATFMDEVTTGLDSATAFDIVSRQREIATKQQKTVVMALLQPTPEVFELFDNVLLLNNGEVIYHGPRNLILWHFEKLGLLCPLDVDVADFLLDIGTNQQRQYEFVRPGSVLTSRVPRLGSEFARHFRQSRIFFNTMRILEGPWSVELLCTADYYLMKVPEFRQSLWSSSLTLLRRQVTIALRNKKFLSVRALMAVLGGLIYGTTFYHVDLTNVQVTMGILYQTAVYLSMGQVSEIPTFIKARGGGFYKQRRANFYRTISFVIAYLAAVLPVIVGECVVFGSFVYWMCGFVTEIGPFLLFLLNMFLSSIAVSASFLTLAALSPTLDVAQPLATLSNSFFSVFAGFVVPMAQIPDYFSWLYWINPVAWCVRSVIVNQYRTSKFDVCVSGGKDYCQEFNATVGEYLLSQYDVPSDKEWIWGGVVYLVLFNAIFVAITSYILEHKRFDTSPQTGNESRLRKKKISPRKRDPFQLHLQHHHSHEDGEAGYYFKLAAPGLSSPVKSSATYSIHAAQPQFKPVTLAFVNLWYSVKVKRESVHLLQGISGYALPGTMTALMGSSGAGKTTLMDVIAGRKTAGKVRGEVLLNGYHATERAIRQCTGYCEQQDIHSEGSTVREALTFSALLRQDSDLPIAARITSVEECLELLDLRSNADQLVRNLSQEQLKRLSIGVELTAQPSVLFLDEPTSGLDARSAKIIMEGVRRVANTGRTIVCTIHQPSSDVFFLFDNLLLLRRGGEMVFFGELVNTAPDHRECGHLIDYFEEVPGISRLHEGRNAATWMLECIGAGAAESVDGQKASHFDFVQHFQQSTECRDLMRELDQPGVGKPATGRVLEVDFKQKRAASSWLQFCSLTHRFFTTYWRSPSYNLTRLVIALGFGACYLRVKSLQRIKGCIQPWV
ncbi:ABC transporter G family member 41 [Phytophthora rubi]|uniref:ABC transporter G family member 41 n=1 Tax=Phytophthora rubi TaxID=129364 RepID=A0A6A4F823_9STRA|nr:ABC transporter G family member 41 [Phytophthora rubi]